MERTMKGFLLAECNRLAGLDKATTSLKKLYKAALPPSGARCRVYVLLLAVERKQVSLLSKLDATAKLFKDEFALAFEYESDAELMLEQKGELLGKRYSQVLAAFRAPNAQKASDAKVKELMLKKTLEELTRNGSSMYSLLKAAGVNKGNGYAYLSGNVSKVSRSTARHIYDCAKSM